MKSLLIFLLIFFTLFMLSSCKKNNNPVSPSDTQQQIWPLKIGNTWGYHVVTYDSTGNSNSSNTSLSVLSDSLAGNETWYIISHSSPGIYYSNRSDGLWTTSNGVQSMFFKYPGKVGDSWQFSPSQSVIIESTDTLVSTSLKNYSCYLYRFFYNGQRGTDAYLSPGVGLVAEDFYSSMSSGQEYRTGSLSLTSLTLK